ncbi:PucR family transcriptional regulator [Rhodococcus sp. T7]|uniref:PucR family transcriptional regulator n=1 Tax=Rhodococcus sp. T7 TaxID=627444 RepID=UPI00135B61EF|nr:helix-turn-helix domain-containing protein [Rhodococcus sp. T7]KAF0957749.1 hypothetical protein MLGJGCBP_09581 [Rhodococcus sp. T7]KAF0959915.1 hypothetical protein MLGJGCBP_06950 [Rhodococcus sp. T7]
MRLAESGPLTDFHHAALSLGATAIALELTKEFAALEAEWRVRGELLEELLQAGAHWSDSLRRRAHHAGIDVAEPCVVAVVEALPRADQGAMLAMFRAAGTAQGILIGTRGERVVVALPHCHRPLRWVQEVLERARAKGLPLIAGLSEAHPDLARGLNEAQAALRLARDSGKPAVVVDASVLGPLRIMLDVQDTTRMVELVRNTLGPLAEYDRRRQGDLLETLRTFLDVGGNHPATAERCKVHLNTVKYRLSRAADILDRPLGDHTTRFELSLAYAVWDVLDALEITPFTTTED